MSVAVSSLMPVGSVVWSTRSSRRRVWLTALRMAVALSPVSSARTVAGVENRCCCRVRAVRSARVSAGLRPLVRVGLGCCARWTGVSSSMSWVHRVGVSRVSSAACSHCRSGRWGGVAGSLWVAGSAGRESMGVGSSV